LNLHSFVSGLVTLLLAIGAVLMVLPVLWMILSAFRDVSELVQAQPSLLPGTWTLDPLRDAWSRFALARMTLNSLIVVVSITALTVASSAYIGYALHECDIPLRSSILRLVIVSAMIPTPVLMLPHFSIMASLGWLDTYRALILPYALWGFGVFLYFQSLERFPRDLLEAARLEGVSEARIFLHIALPLTSRTCAAIAAITFLNHWVTLLWPLLVANPAEMRLLSSGLASFASAGPDVAGRYNPFAAALLSALPLLLATLIVPAALRHRIK